MKNNALISDQHDTSVPQEIYEELITWTVKLSSGLAKDDDRTAFANWRASNPLHEKAWLKLQAIDANFQEIGSETAPYVSEAIDLANQRRKVTSERRKQIKLLSLSVIAILGAYVFTNSYAPGLHEQSYVAAIGKKETFQLADGTKLMLNTNTKVDVKYSFLKREIVLKQGEIYIETGHDTDSLIGRRSFWVKTEQAGLEAIGTRFSVKQAAITTRLHVAEGIVAMHVGDYAPVRAYANDTYNIVGSEHLPTKLNALTMDPVGWVDNVLVAKQMRLEDFAAELSSYRTEPVYCDASSKDLKVSGVFQLDVTNPVDHTLKAVIRTLPVMVTTKPDNSILISHK